MEERYVPHDFTSPSQEQTGANDEKRRLQDALSHLQDYAEEARARRDKGASVDADEIAEAKDILAELIEAAQPPQVTVERKHLESILKNGLEARETEYQKGVKLIVGTIGREPLLPEGQDRVILRLELGADEIEPRFTGENKLFEGVFAVKGGRVPPEKIKIIDPRDEENLSRAA